MKFTLLLLMFFIVSCGSIKTTQNIEKTMKGYTFSFPAKKVYSASKDYFNNMYSKMVYLGATPPKFVDGKKNQGKTTWLEKTSELGGKKYKERSRFIISVKSVKKGKSKLIISDNRMSKLTGKWLDSGTFRMPIHEYSILKTLDPNAAKKIQIDAKNAATKK